MCFTCVLLYTHLDAAVYDKMPQYIPLKDGCPDATCITVILKGITAFTVCGQTFVDKVMCVWGGFI